MDKFCPEKEMTKIRREFGEHGGVSPSISRSSTFTVMDPKVMQEIFEGARGPHNGGCFLYSRHFNPTVDTLARELAAMEGTESAVCTASGMAAISSALLQICHSGDHIVSSDTVYGGTHALLDELFPEMGIETTFVPPDDPQAFEDAIRPETKVIYTETVGNPTLKVSDIPALSTIAKRHGAILVVDNTFSPMMVTPSVLGADIVIHSLTKYINGASDVIAGVVCCSKDFVYQLMDLHRGRVMLLGPTMDARTAFDIQQRLPHLAVRMKEHSHRAMAMSKHLQDLGVEINYPGLPSHPQHDLITSMLNEGYGYGGIFTIECETTEKADQLMNILQNKERFGLIAVSLGYFDTLMSCSASSTSSEIAQEKQKRMGLSPGLIRLSLGITGTLPDRIEQIERAVREVGLI